MLRYLVPILAGKAARVLTRLRGGGSAFPGFVVNKMAPSFLKEITGQFPHGIVFVLGSNGKSTTTRMLSDIVRAHGLRVFTNPSGANLPQGITSALLSEVGPLGKLKADIGILEVDEAFAVALSETLRPSTVLMLNVQVDQLYRFFETERVADMMLDTAATASAHIVTNREDPYLSAVRNSSPGADISYFGAAASVISQAPHGLLNAVDYRSPSETVGRHDALAEVLAVSGSGAVIAVAGTELELSLPAKGLHYAIDAAAAVATAAVVLGPDFDPQKTVDGFRSMKPAYGRGELLDFGTDKVEFIMFKNAPSLQLNLDAIAEPPERVMIAIDEGTPDISWIYDVQFSALDHVDVISGAKAWQVALRLEYAGIRVDAVEPELNRAIELMRALPATRGNRMTWIVNYEQMMLARKQIGFADMEISH
ncbi:MAG: MurT ligase domain-containing protein [Microbacteriaceae bacterium]